VTAGGTGDADEPIVRPPLHRRLGDADGRGELAGREDGLHRFRIGCFERCLREPTTSDALIIPRSMFTCKPVSWIVRAEGNRGVDTTEWTEYDLIELNELDVSLTWTPA
jgi:hypothetical protein